MPGHVYNNGLRHEMIDFNIPIEKFALNDENHKIQEKWANLFDIQFLWLYRIMDDKNILNNLSTLSDNDYLYFCNYICESYANNTYERDSIHYNISHNKNLYDKIV